MEVLEGNNVTMGDHDPVFVQSTGAIMSTKCHECNFNGLFGR